MTHYSFFYLRNEFQTIKTTIVTIQIHRQLILISVLFKIHSIPLIHNKKIKIMGTVIKMIEVSKNPVLYRRMPFGKHKGMKMEEVPLDYLQWLAGTDLEEDLKYTIERLFEALSNHHHYIKIN